MKLDTIELFIDEDDKDGIDAISFVKEPAIEENWYAFSKQEVKFKSIDDEKRIVVGIALVPDKEIYRRKGDYEFNVIFSKDTVRKASHLYLAQLKSNNATLEHEEETFGTPGLSMVESWIVEDPKNDKSNLYELGATEGSWCVMMKVDNDDVWKDVKDGTYLGFSIEGAFSDRKVKASSDEVDKSAVVAEAFISSLSEEEINTIYDNLQTKE